jgi:MerR family transcriptional regulator, copper efflux regulator
LTFQSAGRFTVGGVTTYRISQLARRAGMKATALRFYEQRGLLPARRSGAGYRLYDDESLERLRFIASGKRLGLPLEEIRDLLRIWEGGLCTDVRDRLRPMLHARVAQAERRADELREFTGRLRSALAEIDGPPREGRCDPGCGFLRRREPVPVDLRPPPLSCALTGPERADRLGRWRTLLAGAEVTAVPGGLSLRVPDGRAGALAALAGDEARCCPFLSFALRIDDGGARFEVTAPAAAAPLLAEVFGCPDPVSVDRCYSPDQHSQGAGG